MHSIARGGRAVANDLDPVLSPHASSTMQVRLQFATAPGLMQGMLTQVVEGKTYPDSTRCVQIATTAAIQEMVSDTQACSGV